MQFLGLDSAVVHVPGRRIPVAFLQPPASPRRTVAAPLRPRARPLGGAGGAWGSSSRRSGARRSNYSFTNVLAQIGLGYTFAFLVLGRPLAVQLGVALVILLG